MLKRNMNPPKSCNGTRLIVTKVYVYLIEDKIITAPEAGEITFIPCIPLAPSDHPIPSRRLQFPLRVCFAMTTKGCSILYVMGGAGLIQGRNSGGGQGGLDEKLGKKLWGDGSQNTNFKYDYEGNRQGG